MEDCNTVVKGGTELAELLDIWGDKADKTWPNITLMQIQHKQKFCVVHHTSDDIYCTWGSISIDTNDLDVMNGKIRK